MPTRFQRAPRSRRTLDGAGSERDAFGHWWAAMAIIAFAVVGVFALSGVAHSPDTLRSRTPTIVDPSAQILASLHTAEQALAEINESFETLCREPVLVALELEPDCQSGTLVLDDGLFGANVGSQLRPSAKEDVRAAITTYLQRLREMPAIWESLEALEFRGHSDPRAFNNPYSTNLVGSQQRALGVLLYLVGPTGLDDQDREDLQRLATVSGASYSRPPANCPEDERRCYPDWRRVEVRPVLSESMRRGDWSRTLESVRVVTRRAQAQLEPSTD